jgi:glycosyltransferase involved in cell wall biosynthesis
MRVLQIGMTDNLGGIETFLINYYRNIDKTKIQFDFVNIYDKKLYFQDEIENMGGKVYKLTSYYKKPIKYIKELIRTINENNYEIIHCNMNSAAMIYPLIAGKFSKAKIIIAHSHNSSSDKGILKSILHSINKHFIPFFANTFFACSNEAGKWFFSEKIRNHSNYHIIYNAIDFNRYLFDEEERKNVRKKLNINENTLVIGHVGRFNKQKNHKFLIDIFYKYQKKVKDSKLILIGIGPLKEKIEKKVKKLNIQDKVLFLNQRNDVDKLLQGIDVFVLPSLYEGLPLAGVEAQVSGLICLFSDNITKELKISNNAFFIDLSNEEKWISKIKKNIDRKNSSNKIQNFDFSIKKATTNIYNIYIELMKGEEK